MSTWPVVKHYRIKKFVWNPLPMTPEWQALVDKFTGDLDEWQREQNKRTNEACERVAYSLLANALQQCITDWLPHLKGQ